MRRPDFLGPISAAFADMIRTGRPHPRDARRGLVLQELIHAAEEHLR